VLLACRDSPAHAIVADLVVGDVGDVGIVDVGDVGIVDVGDVGIVDVGDVGIVDVGDVGIVVVVDVRDVADVEDEMALGHCGWIAYAFEEIATTTQKHMLLARCIQHSLDIHRYTCQYALRSVGNSHSCRHCFPKSTWSVIGCKYGSSRYLTNRLIASTCAAA
jgi:hypothetical protein